MLNKINDKLAHFCELVLKSFKNIDIISTSLIFIATVLCYTHTISFDYFIFDDYYYFIDNNFFKDLSIFGLIDPWLQSRTPVIFNFWQIVALFTGLDNAAPFRALNISFHCFNGVLLYFVIKGSFKFLYKELDDLNYAICALVGALLFVVHPIQVESVVWISSFRGTLATFFALLSITFYFKSINVADENKVKIKLLSLSFIFYMLGLLSKPSIVPLPLLFILLDYFVCRYNVVKILTKNIAYFFMMLIAMIMHVIHPEAMSIAGQNEPVAKRAIIVLDSLRVTVLNILAPINLSFDYQLTPTSFIEYFSENVVTHSWKFIGFYFIAFLIIYKLYNKKRKIFLWGVIVFLSFFIVHSGLIPFVFQNISTVSNRYAYIPIIGLSIVIAGVVHIGIKKYKYLTLCFFSSIILIFAFSTIVESSKWKKSETILLSSYKNHETSLPLNLSLGTLYKSKGNITEAEKYFLKAKIIDPYQRDAYIALLELYSENNSFERFDKLVKEIDKRFAYQQKELGIVIAEGEFRLNRFSAAQTRSENFLKIDSMPKEYIKRSDDLTEELKAVSGMFMPEAYRRIGLNFYEKKELKLAKVWLELSYDATQSNNLKRFLAFLDKEIAAKKKPTEKK